MSKNNTNNNNHPEQQEEIRRIFVKNPGHNNGGSMGVLLPQAVKNKIGLQKGDYVSIMANGDMIIIRKIHLGGPAASAAQSQHGDDTKL